MYCLTPLPWHILYARSCLLSVTLNASSHPFPHVFLCVISDHRDFDPAVCGHAVFLLVSLVVVPVSGGVAALLTLVGLLPGVPKHVPFQVHALVAAVTAHGALEGLGARVHALVPLQVGQVPAGVVAQMALVGFLSGVHSVVALEVVEVGGGVVALRALVGLLAAVRFHVAGQVVGVVCEERAGGAGVNLVAALPGAVRRRRRVFSQHFKGALGTDLGRRAVLVFQDYAAQSAGKGKQGRWERSIFCYAASRSPAATAARHLQQGGRLVAGSWIGGRCGWRRRSL